MSNPLAPLDSAIANLKGLIASLGTDQPAALAALQRLLLEANSVQSILLVAGVVSAKAGTAIALPVTLLPGDFGPSGIQADFAFPTGLNFTSASLGPIPAGEGKSIQTSMVGAALRVLVFGLNNTIITDGIDFTLNLNASIKGNFAVTISNPVASDPAGNILPLCVTSGLVKVQ